MTTLDFVTLKEDRNLRCNLPGFIDQVDGAQALCKPDHRRKRPKLLDRLDRADPG